MRGDKHIPYSNAQRDSGIQDGTCDSFAWAVSEDWLKCHKKLMRLKRRHSRPGTRSTKAECYEGPESANELKKQEPQGCMWIQPWTKQWCKKHAAHRLPWWASGGFSTLPRQGVQVRPLVRELDSTCCNKELQQLRIQVQAKHRRSHMLQLRLTAAK